MACRPGPEARRRASVGASPEPARDQADAMLSFNAGLVAKKRQLGDIENGLESEETGVAEAPQGVVRGLLLNLTRSLLSAEKLGEASKLMAATEKVITAGRDDDSGKINDHKGSGK